MSGIIEKLGSYQIMTTLLPGAFLGLTLKFFWALTLPTENIGEDIVVYYFMGLIINRIGSLVVEPVLKRFRFIVYASYLDYTKAKKIDSKIDTLSETNIYFRSLLTGVMLLPVIRILHVLSLNYAWFSMNWKWGALIFLLVLFLFTYRKQTQYVCKRIEAVNSQVMNEKEIKSNLIK